MKTLAEIKQAILRLVQKNASYQGYFTDEKIEDCINEAFDLISVDMFAAGEGWLREQRYLDWTANSRVLEIPPDVAIIHAVRWKNGNQYYPLKYDPADTTVQQAKGTGATAEPLAFRIVQNKIYLNPEPSSSGTAQIELEFSRYPTRLVGEQQQIMSDFDTACVHYLKYYVANTIIRPTGKEPPFLANEQLWYAQMTKIIQLRNRTKQVVADFGS
jgi:hypothetical protein